MITLYIHSYLGELVLHDGTTNCEVGPGGRNLYDGNWHFAVITRESNSDAKVYIDGQLGNTCAGYFLETTVRDFGEIGGWRWDSWDFDGLIDEVMIYDRALSATEIQNIYDAQKSIANKNFINNFASILSAIQKAMEEIKSQF